MFRLFGIFFLLLFVHPGFGQEIPFYKVSEEKINGESFIYDIEVDEHQVTWMASSEGLYRITINTDSLYQYPENSEWSSFATALFYDHKNHVLIVGFFDGTLSKLSEDKLLPPFALKSGKIDRIVAFSNRYYVVAGRELIELTKTKEFSITNRFTFNGNIKDLLIRNDEFYLLTDKGIHKKDGAHFPLIKEVDALCFASDRAKTYLFGRKELFQLEDKRLISLGKINYPAGLNSLSNATFYSEFNQFYFASNLGLLSYSTLEKNHFISPVLGRINNLGASINALHKNKNTLWLGTFGEGAWFARPTLSPIWFKEYSNFQGDSSLWVAENETGVAVVGNGSILGNLRGQNRRITGFIKYLGEDRFLSSRNGKLVLENGKSSISFPIKHGSSKILDACIWENSLVVSHEFNGVIIYPLEANNQPKTYNTSNGLLHNDIIQVIPEGNQLWMLSRESGIFRLNKDGSFSYFTLNEGLPSLENTAITLYENDLWISSEGGGLSYINSNDEVISINENEGKIEYLYGIGTHKGYLITYSRDRISVFGNESKKTIALPPYAENVVPNEGPVASLPSGIGIKGFGGALFIPESQISSGDLESSGVAIQSIQSNISGKFKNNALLKNGKHEVEIKLDLKSSNPLLNPQEIEYQLTGYHLRWQSLNQNKIILPSVRFGKYALKVRLKGEEQTLYTFTIAEPIWRNPIFIGIIFTLILIIYLLILRWRTYRLKKRNEELEEIVKARTKDLAKRNEELQQFTYAISHDLKNPAANIKELVIACQEDFPEINDELDFYLGQIGKASSKLYQNLLDLLEVLKHANSGELPTESVDIKTVIENIEDKISNMLQSSGGKVALNLQHFKTLEYNKANLESILYNLVSNGIKYRDLSRPPLVQVSTFETDKHLGIIVKDNGLGMDLERHKENLFGLFQRFHDHVEGSGVGLYLVNAMVEKNGGFIELDSTPGQGSTFRLHLVPKAPEGN
ncbi:sensor histidine kinase [Luteibaculum oceani]|uniref:histidine kinase n=1 Tax=Luteibaculum oceani TaxID=1294296 RepID=A0A5C6UXS0_9FLAO|nr:HAMP domain-containing sensor histidine kinase [Luteibaculum oceani]TXC77041.1 hypothetical protein FRX97_09250 [Luteibaculum oceani]